MESALRTARRAVQVVHDMENIVVCTVSQSVPIENKKTRFNASCDAAGTLSYCTARVGVCHLVGKLTRIAWMIGRPDAAHFQDWSRG